MLIAVDRDVVTGQLCCGWSHGMYWRGIRATEVYGLKYQEALVYVRVLVPDSRFDLRLRPLGDVGGLPPLHNTDRGKHREHGLSLCRVSRAYGGFTAEFRLHWYETYYGTQYLDRTTRRVLDGAICRSWHPRRVTASHVYATRCEFMKHIRPAAHHICKCIAKVRAVPASAIPDHATVTN